MHSSSVSLIVHAPARLWHRGAQVHQMPQRSTRRDQGDHVAGKRVPDEHHVVMSLDCRADHVGLVIEARRGVVDGQFHRDHVMAGFFQQRSQ